MAKLLVDRVREDDLQHAHRAIVAAVFFDFRYITNDSRVSTRGLFFRSLLYQILECDPSVLSGLDQLMGSITPLPEFPEDLDDRHYERCLKSALFAATENAEVFIVIDGLDECTPDMQDDLIICIWSLYATPPLLNRVRVVVTSRSIPTKHQIHEDSRPKKITMEMENAQDIATYCSDRLWSRLRGSDLAHEIGIQSNTSVSENDIQRLIDEITLKASGMFLWVRLAVDSLLTDLHMPRPLTKEWQKAIQALPSGLESLYEALLVKAKIGTETAARHVLAWCTVAARPLSVDEVRDLFSHNDGYLDFKGSNTWTTRFTDFCGNLVEIVSDPRSHNKYVRLVHHTVKTFLTGDGARHIMSRSAAHSSLSFSCFRSLQAGYAKNSGQRHALLDYSLTYWSQHAKLSDTWHKDQRHLIDALEWQFWIIVPFAAHY